MYHKITLGDQACAGVCRTCSEKAKCWAGLLRTDYLW